jgi:hypothetical protein
MQKGTKANEKTVERVDKVSSTITEARHSINLKRHDFYDNIERVLLTLNLIYLKSKTRVECEIDSLEEMIEELVPILKPMKCEYEVEFLYERCEELQLDPECVEPIASTIFRVEVEEESEDEELVAA